MIKSIPAYYYQSTRQVGIAKMQIWLDNDIYDTYKVESFPNYIHDSSYLHVTNLRDYLYGVFGFDLIPPELEFYIGMNPNDVLGSDFNKIFELLGIIPKFITGLTRSDERYYYPDINVKTLNNFTFDNYQSGNYCLGYISINNNIQTHCDAINPNCYYNNISIGLSGRPSICVTVFPEAFFDENGTIAYNQAGMRFYIEPQINSDKTEITAVRVRTWETTSNLLYSASSSPFNLNGSQSSDIDPENANPFSPISDDNPGGDGDYTNPNAVDPTEVPSLPTIGASDFVTIYNPTSAQLTDFSQFLWSGTFDIDTFKKITQDPFDCIIGLNVLPCVPSSMGTKHIKLGNIDTEITSNYCSSQWVKVDCGSVAIKTTANSFMDYSPHVKITLFLPFVGFEPLNPDDIMGGSINVTYHIDVVSGDLVCFITHSKKGVLYCYNGNCMATIPLTQGNWGGFLKNYYQQIASVIPSMVSGGMSGGAAGAAVGGLTQSFNAAGSILLNNKPDISRSGSMSGAAGIMGVKKPFIIIERPNISVPADVEKFAGLTSNKTVSLGGCSGFTKVDFVHIDNVDATREEITEIENLLAEGVIL